ncbi:transposase, IS605 OrfB family, central region [Natronorubrum sediminis]|uniref:Transposase, IS605 OrfB family, central region n=1 Tax=Natronorubrum sediminis TaxID=640943 RepID=A0A1H6G4U9_9EURY|nr:RNA-guided endonuclease TnpB family protein [Natronorubrum sediminis]SEH18117.1 transposase, IS605 OrfB family, central region [Natronorubrum sediminis]
MQDSGLTQTISFGLTIHEGSSENLHEGCLEARRVRNEVNRLDNEGWDWDDIHDTVVDNANLVKNTTQLIVQKALKELETYYDYKDNEWGRPFPYIDETYPMRMNHNEGYSLTLDESGDVRFRVSYKPYNHVKGVLRGSPYHLEGVKNALASDAWCVGAAELVYKHDEWRLHVTVTHKTRTVAAPDDAETVVGVDINEDCVALTALNRDTGDVLDSVVIEYPDIKRVRHEFFTKRKRMQNVGQTAFETVVRTEERDFVHDQLHKVSRDVTQWVSQFNDPVIVFEDLKDIRDSIDYGTRMNRRLHSLPFAALRVMVTYKAAWEGIPSDDIDPEYTSQRCPRTGCLHIERANRRRKRFKCNKCGFQDHADRKAAVCVAQEWVDDQDGNVPSLETLPRVRKVRRTASGLCEEADSHGAVFASGVYRHGTSARDSQSQAREELKTVAPTTGQTRTPRVTRPVVLH